MIGWRGRLGFLLPPGNPTVEPEMIALAPEGVSVHFHRMAAHGAPGSLEGQDERMGDGWIKDGDFNSTFSKTVLPLPYHAKDEYNTPPGRLEDEWVYRQHPEDWQNYHTRYVTPDVFQNSLRRDPR